VDLELHGTFSFGNNLNFRVSYNCLNRVWHSEIKVQSFQTVRLILPLTVLASSWLGVQHLGFTGFVLNRVSFGSEAITIITKICVKEGELQIGGIYPALSIDLLAF
jgi:hypothetical protein